MTKRLFVAIELPPDIKKELSIICDFFTQRELFVGRCTCPENLHLTLKFIGLVYKDVVPAINEKLKNIYCNACTGTLAPLGVLPTRRISRILYAGLDCFCLPILAKQIQESLKDYTRPKDHEFKNHITLARMKQIPNKEDFLYALDNFGMPELSFDIKEFVLKESELTREGPIYTTIARYTLY